MPSGLALSELPARLLYFRVLDAELAAPPPVVDEIVPLGPLTAVPGVPPHVRGLLALRGQALPVVDLGIFLGLGASASEAPRVLVIHVAPFRVGLLADRVLGVRSTHEARQADLDVVRPDRLRSLAIAALDHGAGVATVLDLRRLLEAARA
jgi:chemotaxis signal transduction protein